MDLSRSSGILLPLNSLPGIYGIGTIGSPAFEFIDFLRNAGQTYWQICPWGHVGKDNSPYICFSAYAGNPYLIDLFSLVKEGFLNKDQVETIRSDSTRINYSKLKPAIDHLLKITFTNFQKSSSKVVKKQFEQFIKQNDSWLIDYARFMSLHFYFKGITWNNWPKDIKFREKKALHFYDILLRDEILFYQFVQFIFDRQWKNLKSYAQKQGIKIIGDVPIFLSYESADVWSNPKQFLLDKNLKPTHIAGVPPDYFSKTGQLWGNPLYDWKFMKKDKFRWWINIFKHLTKQYDVTRIDHFRGFCAYWKIKNGAPNAIKGKWEKANGKEMFNFLFKELKTAPFIAEDLGVITKDVIDLKNELSLPGMSILQFAFDKKERQHILPYSLTKDSVVYTGTHDNDTVKGWFDTLPKDDQHFVLQYLQTNKKQISKAFIIEALKSPCILSIIPAQDLLNLGSESRINVPGIYTNIYRWKLDIKLFKKLKTDVEKDLYFQTALYQRMNQVSCVSKKPKDKL